MSYTLTTIATNRIFNNERLLNEEAQIMHEALLRQGDTKHGTEMSANFNQAVKNEDTMAILKKKVLKLRD
jgi:hypothetical protein